jgi:hypothetical protein
VTSFRRRELLAAGAAAGVAVGLQRTGALAAGAAARTLDFGAVEPGEGWPGWASPGVAALHRRDGLGVLEAGSDVFPCDPRPVAFAIDQRFRDGEVEAVVRAGGAGVGVVLRRSGPRRHWAAVYDDEQGALVILRRHPDGAEELARVAVVRPSAPFTLVFAARGSELRATLGDTVLTASDPDPRAGDPGVLATARTLFPSAGPAVLPALGNLHLLPYGVQEGAAVTDSAAGQQVLDTIRERSTAAFERVAVRTARRRVTPAGVVAATNGAPLAHGANLRVAADLPARVEVEVADNPGFHGSRRLPVRRTGPFDSAIAAATGLPAGQRVYWRARVRRRRRETVGPVRSFRALPRAGGRATVAIGSCAAQFGPVFGHIAARRPDVFLWQGDLNYPDTLGPLAQSVPAYAGIWRDFLANPGMASLLGEGLFAAQRDDHDYGVQDANSTNLVPWGLAPWRGLMEPRLYYRFTAGSAELWVLDQRRHKTDPTAPDTEDKTLLGPAQRAWLLRTLAASKAPFKVVCSPCTVAPLAANARDGSWATGFTAERELLLRHVRERVSGTTIFVTGDTHWTMAYERDGLFEARPCPLGIPTPNDITLTQPNAAEDARTQPGVLYADDDKGHVAFLDIAGDRLGLSLVDETGASRFARTFTRPR